MQYFQAWGAFFVYPFDNQNTYSKLETVILIKYTDMLISNGGFDMNLLQRSRYFALILLVATPMVPAQAGWGRSKTDKPEVIYETKDTLGISKIEKMVPQAGSVPTSSATPATPVTVVGDGAWSKAKALGSRAGNAVKRGAINGATYIGNHKAASTAVGLGAAAALGTAYYYRNEIKAGARTTKGKIVKSYRENPRAFKYTAGLGSIIAAGSCAALKYGLNGLKALSVQPVLEAAKKHPALLSAVGGAGLLYAAIKATTADTSSEKHFVNCLRELVNVSAAEQKSQEDIVARQGTINGLLSTLFTAEIHSGLHKDLMQIHSGLHKDLMPGFNKAVDALQNAQSKQDRAQLKQNALAWVDAVAKYFDGLSRISKIACS